MPNGRRHPGRACDAHWEGNWVVLDRYCNHSAFNGYRCTPSSYSAVLCLSCKAYWRTNAKYTTQLRDATKEERTA
jgi:hypothetical protein